MIFKNIKLRDRVAFAFLVALVLISLTVVRCAYAAMPHLAVTVGGGYEPGNHVTFSADKDNHNFAIFKLEAEIVDCIWLGYLHNSSPGHDRNVVDALIVTARIEFGGSSGWPGCGP